MSKNTPGPWTVELTLRPDLDDDPLGEYVVQPAALSLSTRYYTLSSDAWIDGESEEHAKLEAIYAENRANAHLIAAAPDLLEACKTLLAWALGQARLQHLNLNFPAASAAIAKAEGRTL